MLWLDHLLFGNGHGMASPHCDDVMYWLVDTKDGRSNGKGRLYRWIGGHGAQLESFEWTVPAPGTRRRLAGREFRPFSATRRLCRVEVSWATALPSNLDQANSELRELKHDLSHNLIGMT